MVSTHIAELIIEPPSSKPHIHVVINVLFSAIMFGGMFIYLYMKQFKLEKIKKD
jgi:hypothetical protein